MNSSIKLAEGERKFAELIWKNEPVSSGALAKLAEEALSWKRTTTYTVLKRLQERELFVNEGGIVRSLLSKAEYELRISEDFLREAFQGSLPSFLAAFTAKNRLTESEVLELKKLIDSYSEH